MKKIVSVALILTIVFSLLAGMSVSSNAYSSHSQSEAVNWAKSRVGKKTGDGQCVALTKAYYEYLGVSSVKGNGCDYAWNSVPSGWTRIPYSSGFIAKPGDIAVWTWNKWAGDYGHVAIVTSADASRMYYVDQGKTYGYVGHSGNISYTDSNWRFYGVIRPDFVPFNVTNYKLLEQKPEMVKIQYTISNPNGVPLQKRKYCYKKQSDSKWKVGTKTYSTPKKNNVTVTCTLSNLSENTTYDFGIQVYVDGAWKYIYQTTFVTPARISIKNAQLSGSSSVKYTGSNIALNNLIKISYNGSKLVKGTDYKFSTDYVKSIGKHTITITGIGTFKGSGKVTITVYPKTPTLNSLSYSKLTGRISLKWARVADCTKQQIAISTSSTFDSSKSGIVTVDSSKQSCSIYNYTVNGKKLHVEKGKTYYMKMRAYKLVNGEKIYGKWGSYKSIKCK